MKFSESTIHKDGLNLMRTLSNKVKNISVANRETLGNGVIEHMALFMTGMKNCWKVRLMNLRTVCCFLK